MEKEEKNNIKVGLIINPDCDEGLEFTNEAIKILIDNGANVYIDRKYKNFVILNDKITYIGKEADMYNDSINVDYLVILGGDGTILARGEKAATFKKPIFGINLGHLGFLSTIEKNELDQIKRLFTNDFNLESRMMEEIVIQDGGISREFVALNEIVLSGESLSNIVNFEIQYASQKDAVINYTADGIIICTPTGSTAYSLAAGGPIIDPKANVICVNAICPLSIATRPIVFSDESTLRIHGNTLTNNGKILVTIDGKPPFYISSDATITISKSSLYAEFVRFDEDKFYDTINNKMFK